ncbi:MAG: hypothetical protein ABI891_07415 [Acidobacteriota bacterium]
MKAGYTKIEIAEQIGVDKSTIPTHYYSPNDNNAWIALGKNSNMMYILKKEAGNWKTYQIRNAADFSDTQSIFFLDADSGWISTDMGEIFSTKDSGKNWEKLNLDSNKIFTKSIFWTDSQNDWLAAWKRQEKSSRFVKNN